MKLIVQIPCFNEEDVLAQTVSEIPRAIDGIDRVEVLIIDDGSSDRTVEVARAAGVEHIVRHRSNRGLAQSFRTGLDTALRLGADIIVNTDGDNQYVGADIAKLVAPILDGRADIVVGDRETAKVPHFSPGKKRLQWLGSLVVRQLSKTEVPDAVSGFRALSREAALQINILSSFSYTIEMLIQAGAKQLAVCSVPVAVNPKTRDSRLFRSIPHFLRRSGTTIVRIYTMYKPLKVFALIGIILLAIGAVPIGRFLYFYFSGDGGGHIQSLILGGVFVVVGFVTLIAGFIADLISFNRRLMELTLEKVRRLEIELASRQDRDDGQ
jgi:glycosyltransferase involved in cell wall biosynthesis